MSQIEVSFAELHNPLYFGGKNFGTKLDPHRHGGIGLIYDRGEKELIVTWLDKTAIIPISNVSSMTPGKYTPRKEVNVSHPQVAGMGSAQVETPFGHVHAGPGKGKTK